MPTDRGYRILADEFSCSLYAGGAWPRLICQGYDVVSVLESAARAHECLFALLYGFAFSGEMAGNYCWTGEDSDFVAENLDGVIRVCAYAEYYGCLDRVAPVFPDIIVSQKGLWKSVAEDSYRFLELAKKLRCKDIYLDALRHIIEETYDYSNWDEIGEEVGMTGEEAKEHFSDVRAQVDKVISDLKENLQRFHLAEFWIIYNREPYCIHTTFLNAIPHKRRIAQTTRRPESGSISWPEVRSHSGLPSSFLASA